MSRYLGKQTVKFHIDKSLITVMLLMAIFSVVSIFGASSLLDAGQANLYQQQILWYVLGAGVAAFLLWFGTDRLFTGVRVFYWILVVMLAILVLVRFFCLATGRTSGFSIIPNLNGTYGWFVFFNRISFQPAEFMKIVLIIYSADIISQHNQEKTENSFSFDLQLFIKLAKICVIPYILIFLEPETGIILISVISIFVMCVISGIRREWVLIIAALVIIVFAGVIYLYYHSPSTLSKLFGGDYRATRIYGWLDTEKYKQSHGYQLYQALLAYGTAGIYGHGLGSVVVSFSAAQNDFIFALISQNFGFIGGVLVIVLCFVLDLRLIFIAIRYPKLREKYLIAGVLGMLLYQQIQNIGMILGLLPITGITLPFISYGGSSLISYMIPFAFVFSMSSETKNIGSYFQQ